MTPQQMGSHQNRGDEPARNTIGSIGRPMHSEDLREGPRAFRQRRDTVWKAR